MSAGGAEAVSGPFDVAQEGDSAGMWIVKNILRGALYIDELKLRIPPKDYVDLDKLGRTKVEGSMQLKLAFEEGYLQNIKKSESTDGASDTVMDELRKIQAPDERRELKKEVLDLRRALFEERQREQQLLQQFSEFKDVLLREMKALLRELATGRRVEGAPEGVSVGPLSEAELRARLTFLEAKEKEISSNLSQIGKRTEREAEADKIAELLSET